jgi:hypothetical protein
MNNNNTHQAGSIYNGRSNSKNGDNEQVGSISWN